MELKRHFGLRWLFVGAYIVAFLVYIVYGLQPAEAARYIADTYLEIPYLGLNIDVVVVGLKNGKLDIPDTIVGSYKTEKNKTLLVGHSVTAFKDLDKIKLDTMVYYDGKTYRVAAIDMVPKENIDMSKIMAGEDRDTLVMMTCAGRLLDYGDATHRFIVTAIAD